MEISNIKIGNEFYPIKDEVARNLKNSVPIVFKNMADLKANNLLLKGQTVKTLGYYSENDGGGAYYTISENSNNITQDEKFSFLLENNLIANLIIENNTVNIRSLGARPFDGEKYDILPYLNKYLNYLEDNFVKLYIPSGVWHCSQFTFNKKFYVFGDEAYTVKNASKGTYICSLDNYQNIIWTVGGSAQVNNFTISNITFTTNDPSIDQNNNLNLEYSKIKNIGEKCLYLKNCAFGILNNIQFYNIIGKALAICSTWELNWNVLVLHNISNLNGFIVSFETSDTSLNPDSNISDCFFR